MKRPSLLCAVLAIMNLALAHAQSVPSNPPAESAVASPSLAPPSAGLDLLKEVAKRYADAKSHYVQSVEETSSSSDYERSWQKEVMSAAEAPRRTLPLRRHLIHGQRLEGQRRQDGLDL